MVGASKESQGVESLGIGRTTSSHAAGTLPNRLETGTKGCMAGTKQCNVAVILVCLKHEVAAHCPLSQSSIKSEFHKTPPLPDCIDLNTG